MTRTKYKPKCAIWCCADVVHITVGMDNIPLCKAHGTQFRIFSKHMPFGEVLKDLQGSSRNCDEKAVWSWDAWGSLVLCETHFKKEKTTLQKHYERIYDTYQG